MAAANVPAAAGGGSNKKESIWEILPESLLSLCMTYCTPEDCVRASCVNRQWKRIAQDSRLWKMHVYHSFPQLACMLNEIKEPEGYRRLFTRKRELLHGYCRSPSPSQATVMYGRRFKGLFLHMELEDPVTHRNLGGAMVPLDDAEALARLFMSFSGDAEQDVPLEMRESSWERLLQADSRVTVIDLRVGRVAWLSAGTGLTCIGTSAGTFESPAGNFTTFLTPGVTRRPGLLPVFTSATPGLAALNPMACGYFDLEYSIKASHRGGEHDWEVVGMSVSMALLTGGAGGDEGQDVFGPRTVLELWRGLDLFLAQAHDWQDLGPLV